MKNPGFLFVIMFSLVTLSMALGMMLLIMNLYINEGFSTQTLLYFYYPPRGLFEFLAPIPLFTGASIFFILYILIFVYDFKSSVGETKQSTLHTPIAFIAGVGSLFYLLSIILIGVQSTLGEPVKSSLPDSNGTLFYYQLIYAPFVEELEFRIIPIGLYLLFRYSIEKRSFRIWEIFLFPGKLLTRFGRKMDRIDWGVVILTSGLFGYAHYVYGDWSATKIPQAALVGVALALGFMLFGPFVDIPIHFLFDGALTISLMPGGGDTIPLVFIELIFMIICAILCLGILMKKQQEKKIIREMNS
jgi:hypothetical protein